jgi:hypothetical protein
VKNLIKSTILTKTAVFITPVFIYFFTQFKGKGKAIPLLAMTGSELSRKLRKSKFKTIGT